MDLALTNNGVLVVGGAKGIGHAIARQFALEGADVILADIDPHVHQSANTMDADVGGNIRGVVLDATDYQAVETFAGVGFRSRRRRRLPAPAARPVRARPRLLDRDPARVVVLRAVRTQGL